MNFISLKGFGDANERLREEGGESEGRNEWEKNLAKASSFVRH